jgi:hypothetical protein
MGRPLKIAKAQAVLTITGTTAATGAVTVSQSLNVLGNEIIAGMPFIPATSTGNLVGGTTYWILKVLDANNFTVSAVDLSANTNFTAVTLTTTTGTSVAATVGLVDSYFNNPNGSGNTYSVVGGNTAIYGKQVSVSCAIGVVGAGTISTSTGSTVLSGVGTNFAGVLSDGDVITTIDGAVLGIIDDVANATATSATFAANAAANTTSVSYVYATPETGYIVRQKGKQKYLVKGLTTGLVGACYTANVAVASLAPGQMNIVSTNASSGNVYVQSLTDHTAELFTATSGPVATGNIVLANATPVYATFNEAATANASNGQPFPIVTINNA